MGNLASYVLLGGNALAAAAWLVLRLNRAQADDAPKTWVVFAFLLCCPVVAPCALLLGLLCKRLFFRDNRGEAPVAKAEESFSPIAQPDVDSEMNIVSMEEAMIVSHKSDLRRLLLNLLKDGTENSLSAIAMALDSDDSEASHYSASAIADSLAQFHQRVQTMQQAIENDESDVSSYCALIEYLLWYLDKNVLSERELKLYVDKTADLLRRLLEVEPSAATPSFFLDLVSLYIKMGELPCAKQWADEIAVRYPETLETYTANLRYHFAAEDVEGFSRWLAQLKGSKVVINREIMEIIHTLG